jgi:hypothetical protein
MKARYAVVVAWIVVWVGVVGLSADRTYNENIGDAESVVISGSLDFYSTSAPSINNPTHKGVVVCDDVLVINIYFNNDVTVTLDATAFVGSSKTLPTEYGFVAVGTGPSWFGFDDVNLGVPATVGTEFTDWGNTLLFWIDPDGSNPTLPYTWPLDRSAYPSGRKYCNAKVRVQRAGYADPAGTYTATITVTVN